MAWSAQFTESSAENSSITYTPESKDEGVYSVAAFTALQKGIYRFDLYGSGGANGDDPYGQSNGGKGGRTSGYLQLESGQTIYVGAGGLRCAAFVHSKNVESLAATQNNGILYFVAGGGGNGGRGYKNQSSNSHTNFITSGGDGGGLIAGDGGSGGNGSVTPGLAGTQTSGGAAGTGDHASNGGVDFIAYPGTYGTGGEGAQDQNSSIGWVYGGRGGDGYYGGGGGGCNAADNSQTGKTTAYGMGGGGGSAYIQPDYATATWSGEVWTSATVAGGGSPSNTNGYIVITIIKQYAPSTVIPDDEVNAGELFTFRLSNLRIDDQNHSIEIRFGNKKSTITQGLGVDSGQFDIPQDWLTEIPDSAAGTATVIVSTLQEKQMVGTVSKPFTIKAGSDIVPTKGTVSILRTDNSVPEEWGIYVQNVSGATIVADGFTGVYGSSIASYTYNIGNKLHIANSSALAIDTITESGNIIVRVTATDTRGRTSYVEKMIYVSPYSPPAWANAFIERTDATGTAYDLGTYAFLTGEISCASCEGKNSYNASVYYRKTGETNYTYAGTFNQSTGMLFGNGLLDTDYDFDILLRVVDEIYAVDRTLLLNSVDFTIHFKKGGKSVAFGMPASRENVVQLAEGWDIYFGDVSLSQRILNAEAQMEFSVPVSAWSRTSDGSYVTMLANPDVTENTQVRSIEFTGGTENNQTSDIAWNTQEGAIELETDVLPSGDQEGYLEQAEAGQSRLL